MRDSGAETALVFGATGYTGKHVVQALVDRGVATVAHVRPDSTSLDAWSTHFGELGVAVSTAAWEDATVAAAFAQHEPTLVFALLGTTRRRQKAAPGRHETYETVDRDLTLMLIRAAEEIGRPHV